MEKLKVLVVDDEKWIRRGLIQSIPWEELPLELVGEAGDGEDGYQLALTLRPDLLFLDMRMPGLDGKELIGMLSRELPELLTIVVSGYTDFEYTKEAIRHKAYEYLLKPVKKEELAAVLEKAVAELQRRRAGAQATERDGRGAWLQKALSQQEEPPGSFPFAAQPDGQGECRLYVGLPDRYGAHPAGAALLPQLEARLEKERAFHLGGSWSFAACALGDSGEIAVLLHAPAQASGPQELERLAALLLSGARQQGSGCSFGCSAPLREPGEVRRAYRQARTALLARKLGQERVLMQHPAAAAAAVAPYPQEQERALLLALQTGNREAAQAAFARLYGQLSAPQMTVDSLQRSAALLVHALDKLLIAAGSGLEQASGQSLLAVTEQLSCRCDAESIRALLAEQLLPAVLDACARGGSRQADQVVSDVLRLIEAQYDQALSLPEIAGSFYMNPDYFSRLFKRKTGKTFVDYLTDYRIRKSQELLQRSGYKNYEIAKLVGYEDYRYFSQIFKKKTGLTIGEYRKDTGNITYKGESEP